MDPVAFYRQTLIWLHYRNAAFVNSVEELAEAMQRTPPRIVVDGDEALRAYAASLTVSNKAAAPPAPETQGLLAVSPVGRITDGWRVSRRAKKRHRAERRRQGLALPMLVVGGTLLALAGELLTPFAWPADSSPLLPHRRPIAPPVALLWLERGVCLCLGLAATVCFLRAAWVIFSLGEKRRTEWRLEYRIPGRLVMSRMRRRGPA